MRRALTILLLLLGLAAPGWAATYHVACETGDDLNTGGAGDPFLTLQKALDTVGPGDTIRVVNPDTETCRVTSRPTTKINGTQADPITITSDSAPTRWKLRGSELFDAGWTQDGTTWWHSLTFDPGRMVFFDEQQEAAWVATDTSATCDDTLTTDNEFCIDLTNNRLYVRSATNPATRWTSPGVEVIQADHINLLRIDHNWYTVEHFDAQQSARFGILIAGDNTTLDNFELAWSLLNAGRSCAVLSCSGGNALLAMFDGANNTTITNFAMHDAGRDAWDFAGGGTGVVNTGLLIENGTISNVFNHSVMNAIGACDGCTITDVTIRNVEAHDVCAGWFWANAAGAAGRTLVDPVFERLWTHDQVKSDDVRVFSPGEACGSALDAVIQANGSDSTATVTMTHSIFGPNFDVGVYSAPASSSVSFDLRHNLFYSLNATGADFSEASTMTVQDNILTAVGGSVAGINDFLVGCQDGTDCTDFTSRSFANFDFNLYHPAGTTPVGFIAGTGDRTFAQWQTDTGADANSIEDDPLLVDPANADFHLAAASPAIGQSSTGGDIGPYPSLPTLASCEVGGIGDDVVTVQWTDNTWGGVGVVDNTKFDVEIDGLDATETETSIQSVTETRTTLSAAVTSGQEVRVKLARGAVQSVEGIGVSSNLLRAISRADTAGTVCTSNLGLAELHNLLVVSADPDTTGDFDETNLVDDCVDFDPAAQCTIAVADDADLQYVVDLDSVGQAAVDLVRLDLYGDDDTNQTCQTWDAEYSTGDDTGPWTTLFTDADCTGRQFWMQSFASVSTRYVRITAHGPATGTQVAELTAWSQTSVPATAGLRGTLVGSFR